MHYQDQLESKRHQKERIEKGYFSYNVLTESDPEDTFKYYFASGMCSVPGLQHCDGNHEVDDVLRKAGVIHRKTCSDPEYCCLWVYFKSKKSAHNFIDRLNEYIRKNHKKCSECGK